MPNVLSQVRKHRKTRIIYRDMHERGCPGLLDLRVTERLIHTTGMIAVHIDSWFKQKHHYMTFSPNNGGEKTKFTRAAGNCCGRKKPHQRRRIIGNWQERSVQTKRMCLLGQEELTMATMFFRRNEKNCTGNICLPGW